MRFTFSLFLKILKSSFLAIFCLVSFLSCSGYRFKLEEAPFVSYGIKTIAVPMFVNKTIFPNISGVFTKEIVRILTEHPGIEIISGENSKADAVLVGVVTSGERYDEVVKNGQRRFITESGSLKESIGSRSPFYITEQVSINIKIQLTLIKDPVMKEVELTRSKLGSFIRSGPKIIFSKTINVGMSSGRTLNSNLNFDDGGVVNFTNTRGIRYSGFVDLAKSAAQTFKGVVLNAF